MMTEMKTLSILQLSKLAKELLKRKAALIFIAALGGIVLSVALNAIFSKSYGIGCDEYCKAQPHVMCVGYWSISGQYPNCNCQFICWTSQLCASDYDCTAGEKCYSSYETGRQVGDLLCHKICNSGADCIEVTPYCRLVNITIGSSSDLVKMCMMEECATSSDCAQPRCIGMQAICDSGRCKTVDMQGLPARCG